MARKYIVQKRDTLKKISKNFYNDPGLSGKLARYNGILDPDLIIVGQAIEVPSRRELEGSAAADPAATIIVSPHGLDQILSTFGDIYAFLREDGTLNPRWETEHLERADLPFPIPLSWDPSKTVKSVYCHKLVSSALQDVFKAIDTEGLGNKIRTYGGCFNFRSKRTGAKLSTHCWGIAIDLNPETNAMGTAGDTDQGVVEIFKRFGFAWGGDWTGKSKDPMHFQFCTGY